MSTDKIYIGTSDYTRKELVSNDTSWVIGSSGNEVLQAIKLYEKDGYTIKFETSFFRKLFGLDIYKIVGYK